MVFLKFFKWLYSQNELDLKKRITPTCMIGVKRLSKREKTSYKPSDIWDERDIAVFLKYYPIKRDRCYYAMAFDASARPHEILSLHIKDIKFCFTTVTLLNLFETTLSINICPSPRDKK